MNKSLLTVGLIWLYISLSGCSLIAANSAGDIQEDYGKRTLGTQVEDNTIEAKALASFDKLSANSENNQIHAKAFNRVLLITGQVSTEAEKNQVSRQASKIRHVKRVHNELEVIGVLSFLAQLNDSYLATKISRTLIFADGVDASRIECVVENGSAYLMGLVTQEEAARAVTALQNVSGLTKIVKVFEYIDNQTD